MYKITNIYDDDYLMKRFSEKYKELTGTTTSCTGKTIIKTPECQILNRKTFIQNFEEVCSSINRESNDVSNYIGKELQIQTSITSNGCLIIHGTYRKEQIENIVKKYVVNYVQCPLCKTQNTKIEKIDRITYIVCNKCHAQSSFA